MQFEAQASIATKMYRRDSMDGARRDFAKSTSLERAELITTNEGLPELSELCAVRGALEDCDQSVHKYTAETTGERNEEMRQL